YGVTQEHVFGIWLRQIFPRDEKTTHTKGLVEWPNTENSSILNVKTTQGQGHSGSKQVKVVCKTCNGTWLSNQVEEAAKPILIPLIAGRPLTLTPQMQRTLALWAAKTAMTSAYINKGPMAHQYEAFWLRGHLMPPPGWFISIAPYVGSEWRDLGIFQHQTKLELPSSYYGRPIAHNLAQTFLGMGNLLIIVRNSSWTRLFPHIATAIPGAIRIWPPARRDCCWPTPHVLTDVETAELTTFIQRVANETLYQPPGSTFRHRPLLIRIFGRQPRRQRARHEAAHPVEHELQGA